MKKIFVGLGLAILLSYAIYYFIAPEEYDVWVHNNQKEKIAYVVNESDVQVRAIVYSAVKKTIDTVIVPPQKMKPFGRVSIYEVIDIKEIEP